MYSASSAHASPEGASRERRTYVIDTSVLLSDPHALRRFDEHDIVLPIVVITELEGKRHHAELGYFAREALRQLDDLRIAHGRGAAPGAGNDRGGTRLLRRGPATFEPGRASSTGQPHGSRP